MLSEPVKMNAPKIVLVHNHPSGDSTPSQEDFRITERIQDSANVMGIELLDHIVIANRGCSSILGIKRTQEEKKRQKERRKQEKCKKAKKEEEEFEE